MKKTVACLLLLLMTATLLSPALAQTGEPLRVVTSFYPLHIFALNLLDGVPDVVLENLTHPTTGCLHDYQLLASDMKTLAQADALIINGGGMENFLDDVTAQFPSLAIIDSSTGIELIAEESLMHHEGETEEEHAGHDHGEYNAHIWLDPANAMRMCVTISMELSRLLPEHSAQIASNMAAYVARLSALDGELREQLSKLDRRDIVTFHEAFPYFAKAYGLNVVAVLALEPEEALTPAMLSELVRRVKEANLPPLFTEPQYEDRAARAVAQETGAPVFELDPVVTGDGAKDAYERVMRRNAQTLLEALGSK